MAHWAELDKNNIVVRVTVGDDNQLDKGYQWLIDNLGGRWLQTSYDSTIRGNFAGIGYSYDETLDLFLAPKPFESWVLNNATFTWEAPTPQPKGDYQWNEETTAWVKGTENA